MKIEHLQKIAVFQALQLGDMLCSIPAIKALRKACPNAEIVLIGLSWAESFIKRFDRYFNRFIHFPGYPGLPEQPYDEQVFEKFMDDMLEENFDLLIQMQGNGTVVNELVFQMGANYVAGYHNQDCRVNSELFMEYPEGIYEATKHLLLMEHFGIKTQEAKLEFIFIEEDLMAFEQIKTMFLQHKYVCVHPGSRGSWRRWPGRYFAMVANYCIEKGYTVVVTGTEDEYEIANNMIQHVKGGVINLVGKTTLGSLAILIKNASMLISNCTGISHIAVATKTPSIIISMDGEPERWAPVNKRRHIMFDWTKQQKLENVLMKTAFLIKAVERGISDGIGITRVPTLYRH
jgi:ADP-heptose:LPS heptosyltransferase